MRQISKITALYLVFVVQICGADSLDIWSQRVSGTTANLTSVTYTQGMFVIVGDGGTILVSANGFLWSSCSSGTVNP